MPSTLSPVGVEGTPYVGGNSPGFLSIDSSDTQQLKKCNFSATTAPGSTDDSASNYEVGSMWFDVTGDAAYFCLDATASAAVWDRLDTVPAGSDTEIQFNNSGSFGASSNLAWDGTSLILNSDLLLNRAAAATLQMGVDSGTPVDQTIKAPDGSGTDINGAALDITGGDGSATNSNGGNVLVYGGALAGSGTAGNVLLGWDGSAARGNVNIRSADASVPLQVGDDQTWQAAVGNYQFAVNAGSGVCGQSFNAGTGNYHQTDWLVDNNRVAYMQVTSGGHVVFDPLLNFGINETSPGAQLQVTAKDATTIGQIIKLAATPSANAFEVQDSAGTKTIAVDEAFNLELPSVTAATTVTKGIRLGDAQPIWIRNYSNNGLALAHSGVGNVGYWNYSDGFCLKYGWYYGWNTDPVSGAATNSRFECPSSGLLQFKFDTIDWSTPTIGSNVSGTPGAGGYVSEFNGITATDDNTAGSGTAALATFHSFAAPTLAATNASVTTTDAATLYIAGAPTAGTNQTLTNAWALLVDAGNSRMDGDLDVNGTGKLRLGAWGNLSTTIPGIAKSGNDLMIGGHVAAAIRLRPDYASSNRQLSINTTGIAANGSPISGTTFSVNAVSASEVGQTIKLAATPTANAFEVQDSAGTQQIAFDSNFDFNIGDAHDIILGSTTGTKIGTATSQKLGFYNATPVVQPTALTSTLTTITHTEPGTPDYAIQGMTSSTPFGFVTADEGNSVLKVIANLQTRVDELETKFQALGLLA